MIEIKKVNIEDYELDGCPMEFDEYSPDYDLGQWGHNYDYYYIRDMAYWDALVCFDRTENKALAVHSQVISMDEATEYITNFLKEKRGDNNGVC